MQRKRSRLQGVLSADSSTESPWSELTDQIIESRESRWSSTMTRNAFSFHLKVMVKVGVKNRVMVNNLYCKVYMLFSLEEDLQGFATLKTIYYFRIIFV